MERVISAILTAPLVVGIILYGHPWLFFILITSIVLVAAFEYFCMITNTGVVGFLVEGLFLSIILLAGYFFSPKFLPLIIFIIPIALFCIWFFREKNVRVALDSIAYTLFGIFYTAGLGGYFLLIGNLQGGRQIIVFILLFIWAGDIMAYYCGQKLGDRKLIEIVSPNKTVAGAVANIAGTLIAALLASKIFFNEIPLTHCLIVAFICGIIGQFGDLVESLIKRNCQVKDSGTLIPGHGGVLDRIDSLLFAGPAFYFYYLLFLAADTI